MGGAGVRGAAGSVVGASVTATPQTRVTNQREVFYADGRADEGRGHHKHC